jgi:hypothetical protein
LLFQERQQGLVDLGGVGPVEAVGASFDDVELAVGQKALHAYAGGVDGQDLVGFAVDDQRGNLADLELGEVGAEVFEPGVDALQHGAVVRGGANVEAGVDGGVGDVGAADQLLVVEVGEEGLEEGEAVFLDGLLDAFEDSRIDAFDVVALLAQEPPPMLKPTRATSWRSRVSSSL